MHLIGIWQNFQQKAYMRCTPKKGLPLVRAKYSRDVPGCKHWPPHPMTPPHACTALGGSGLYAAPQHLEVATTSTAAPVAEYPAAAAAPAPYTGDTAEISAGLYGMADTICLPEMKAGSKGRTW
jgi:hypothetical protein